MVLLAFERDAARLQLLQQLAERFGADVDLAREIGLRRRALREQRAQHRGDRLRAASLSHDRIVCPEKGRGIIRTHSALSCSNPFMVDSAPPDPSRGDSSSRALVGPMGPPPELQAREQARRARGVALSRPSALLRDEPLPHRCSCAGRADARRSRRPLDDATLRAHLARGADGRYGPTWGNSGATGSEEGVGAQAADSRSPVKTTAPPTPFERVTFALGKRCSLLPAPTSPSSPPPSSPPHSDAPSAPPTPPSPPRSPSSTETAPFHPPRPD